MEVNHELVRIERSRIAGRGIFGTKNFLAGEKIFTVLYGVAEQPFLFINHHCRPNCFMVREAVCALRSIEAGEELTLDYRSIPINCSYPSFHCSCGCGEEISGEL
jgi:hypothetical protein